MLDAVTGRRRTVPATMVDIARLAGVSATTVSRALAGSELVPRHKRDKIAKLASESGYVVNTTARNLRLKRTQALSVVVPLEAGQMLRDPLHFEMLTPRRRDHAARLWDVAAEGHGADQGPTGGADRLGALGRDRGPRAKHPTLRPDEGGRALSPAGLLGSTRPQAVVLHRGNGQRGGRAGRGRASAAD